MTTDGRLPDLTAYLDSYLRVRETPDEPNALNGLQVENSGRVQRSRLRSMPQQTIDGTGNGSLPYAPRFVLGWQSTSHRPPLPPPQSSVDRDVALYAAHIP